MKIWKFAFWLMAVILVLQLVGIPFKNSPSSGDLVGLIISGLSLIPLYGFAYKIAIGSKGIAIVIFSINGILSILGVLVLVAAVWEYFGVLQLVASGLGLVFIWLYMYPQFAYAFRSDELWSGNA